MSDPVWPVPSDRVPTFQTFNAIGTVLMRNTRPDSNGRYFATQWFVLLLPIAPVARYYLRQGETVMHPGGHTIRYEIYGRSRLRLSEIIRAYLYWWAIPPLVGTPIYYAAIWESMATSETDEPSYMVTGMFVSIGLLGLWLAGLWIYHRLFRPVRRAVMVATKPPLGSEMS